MAVEVKLVERGEVQAGTVLSGPVRAQAEVYVLSKLPLQVLAVKVQVGDRVRRVRYCCNLMIRIWHNRSGKPAPLCRGRSRTAAGKEESPAAAGARLAYENAAADLTRMEYLKEQESSQDRHWSKPSQGEPERRLTKGY